MWEILRADERGRGEHGWLSTRHTFSFANWFNPQRMGFGPLRVINEDRVAAGAGFGAHPHRDMEIISYVLDGALQHRDSMGTGSVVRPGEIQYMSAGSGVMHSEFNASGEHPLHFLQIWIQPRRSGGEPRYGQLTWDDERARNRLRVVASDDGAGDSMMIRQDARIMVSRLDERASVVCAGAANRSTFVHVAKGAVSVDGFLLQAGDSAAATGVEATAIVAAQASEVLVFDLA